MIAVTFALPAESSGLTARLRQEKMKRDAVLLHTGVGREKCQIAIAEFLNRSRPDFLVSAGFAGGVREDLQSGDLIFGENFSDRRLLASARQLFGDRIQPVKMHTAPTILDSNPERNEIARASGAAVVDMETEFIVSACTDRGIPVLSLRVISDSVREPLPAPPSVLFDLQTQKTPILRLGGYFLAHPPATLSLIQFAAQIRRARNNLTAALLTLLRKDFLADLA